MLRAEKRPSDTSKHCAIKQYFNAIAVYIALSFLQMYSPKFTSRFRSLLVSLRNIVFRSCIIYPFVLQISTVPFIGNRLKCSCHRLISQKCHVRMNVWFRKAIIFTANIIWAASVFRHSVCSQLWPIWAIGSSRCASSERNSNGSN